jgi:hypothetical protein
MSKAVAAILIEKATPVAAAPVAGNQAHECAKPEPLPVVAHKLSPVMFAKRSEASPGRKTIIDLEHGQCRWPVGESGGRHFFCADATDGASYCAEHKRRAYAPRKH